MTKFSVLLSLYYKEQPSFLIQSLDSILSQTLLPNEIVLVKDGPLTPKLDSIVSEYEKRYNIIKVIPLEKNLGLGKALNEGLKYCSHDLVARMDTDDIAYPNRFEKQVKFMTDHPEIDACSSWIDEFIGSKDNIISTKKLPETSEEIKKYAKHRCPLNHPALIYRKRAVMAVNGYSGFPEDYNLWGRMLMNGSKFYNLQESLLYFRYSPEMIKRRGGWKYAKDELKSQIQFYKMGFIGLNTLIYNSDLCVSPGNVGLTALHSMMFGTPVLSHNDFTTQMPEYETIVEGATGTLYKVGDFEDFCTKIANWLQHDMDREQIRQNCVNMINDKWNSDYQIEILKSNLN